MAYKLVNGKQVKMTDAEIREWFADSPATMMGTGRVATAERTSASLPTQDLAEKIANGDDQGEENGPTKGTPADHNSA